MSRIVQLWDRLTAPADGVESPSEQLSARLLSALLVGAVPVGLLAFISHLAPEPLGFDAVDMLVLSYASLAWLFAYLLSRTSHFRWSAVFVVWMSVVTLLGLSAFGNTTPPLYLMIPPVLLSAFFLDIRMTGGVALALSLGLLLVSTLRGEATLIQALLGSPGLVALVLLMTFGISFYQRRLVEADTAQLRERVRTAEAEAAKQEAARGIVLRDAFHDQLTGLASRPLFEDRLVQAIQRSKRLGAGMASVLIMDLDHFKIVNEHFGRDVGDELLCRISGLLEEIVRNVDTVARFGGDEYVILLENIAGLPEAVHVAERIRSSLESAFEIDGQSVYTTASVGVVLINRTYDRVADILRDAETAMYRAKAKGGGRYEIFDRSLRDQVDGRPGLEKEMRRGLEGGEFVLYFQPISSIRTNTIISFEALVRWNHPDLGMIFPGEFIPLAEESSLIQPLGLWILKEACTQLRSWQRQYASALQMAVNINLSAKQFLQKDFVDQVHGVILDAGIASKSINFEIRENAITQNLDIAVNSISGLKDLGVGIQVDDFGRGYSPFSHINFLPVDTLKIDRSFVQAMPDARRKPDSTRSIIDMAHKFGLSIVAEGIETEQQMRILQGMGADFGQGYYISRPISAIDVESQLKSEPQPDGAEGEHDEMADDKQHTESTP